MTSPTYRWGPPSGPRYRPYERRRYYDDQKDPYYDRPPPPLPPPPPPPPSRSYGGYDTPKSYTDGPRHYEGPGYYDRAPRAPYRYSEKPDFYAYRRKYSDERRNDDVMRRSVSDERRDEIQREDRRAASDEIRRSVSDDMRKYSALEERKTSAEDLARHGDGRYRTKLEQSQEFQKNTETPVATIHDDQRSQLVTPENTAGISKQIETAKTDDNLQTSSVSESISTETETTTLSEKEEKPLPEVPCNPIVPNSTVILETGHHSPPPQSLLLGSDSVDKIEPIQVQDSSVVTEIVKKETVDSEMVDIQDSDKDQMRHEGQVFPLNKLESDFEDVLQLSSCELHKSMKYLSTTSDPFKIINRSVNTDKVRKELTTRISQHRKSLKISSSIHQKQFRKIKSYWLGYCNHMETSQQEPDPTQLQTAVDPASPGLSSRRSRTHGGDTVRSEAEFMEILANLERQTAMDPSLRATQTSATIPKLIYDPVIRDEYRYLDSNNIILDKTIPYRRLDTDFSSAPFTPEEHELFCEAYLISPKQFGRIAKYMGGGRSFGDCVLHYYRTKKDVDYKSMLASKGRKGFKKNSKKKSAQKSVMKKTHIVEDEEQAKKIISLEVTEKKKLITADEHDEKQKQSDELADKKSLDQKRTPKVVKVESRKVDSPSNVWTMFDKNAFQQLLPLHGTDFEKIASKLKTKTPDMIKNYYNTNKDSKGWSILTEKADDRNSKRSDKALLALKQALDKKSSHITEISQKNAQRLSKEHNMPMPHLFDHAGNLPPAKVQSQTPIHISSHSQKQLIQDSVLAETSVPKVDQQSWVNPVQPETKLAQDSTPVKSEKSQSPVDPQALSDQQVQSPTQLQSTFVEKTVQYSDQNIMKSAQALSPPTKPSVSQQTVPALINTELPPLKTESCLSSRFQLPSINLPPPTPQYARPVLPPISQESPLYLPRLERAVAGKLPPPLPSPLQLTNTEGQEEAMAAAALGCLARTPIFGTQLYSSPILYGSTVTRESNERSQPHPQPHRK